MVWEGLGICGAFFLLNIAISVVFSLYKPQSFKAYEPLNNMNNEHR